MNERLGANGGHDSIAAGGKGAAAVLRSLLPGLLGLALGAAATTPCSAQGSGRMVMNATSQPHAQTAVRGARQHDFSPTTPPRQGRYVYGHWTPYSPPDPATYPEDAIKHVIARGDTLWDLANRYYSDPLLWPYIWEANPWVTYPHWIYPGDVLLVPSLLVLQDGPLAAARVPNINDGYVRAANLSDLYCGHFIASPHHRFSGEIIGTETDPAGVMLGLSDVVYIDVGARDGVLPGDEFAIVYPKQHFDVDVASREDLDTQVKHPLTDAELGEAIQMAGRLQVLLLGEKVSTAKIAYACDAVEIGYDIYPFAEVPAPLAPRVDRQQHFNELWERGRGFVVYTQDLVVSTPTGHLVSIDLGEDHGVVPGDRFLVYRDHPHPFHATEVDSLSDRWDLAQAKRRMKRQRDPDDTYVFGKQRPVPETPPRVIGELMVLYTEPDTATAKIIESNQELLEGDRVVYHPIGHDLATMDLTESSPPASGGSALLGRSGNR